MTAKHTDESVKNSHKLGIKGLLKQNSFPETFLTFSGIFALIIASTGTLAVIALNINAYTIIKEVIDKLLNFLPGILGFTITGFTLLVGFLQSDIIDTITQKREHSDFTLYQDIVAKFAMAVFIQSVGLILAYFVHFASIYGDEAHIALNPVFEKSINHFVLFIMLYDFGISVVIVGQVILNIFNFSQLHHFVIVNKRKAEEEKKHSDKSDV